MNTVEYKKVIFSFLGLPASGKGTQSETFAKRKDLKLISIGDLIREEIESEEEKHSKIDDIKDRYETGVPQEDDVIFDLIRKKMKKIEKGVVFDNFPFSERQAELLEELIETDGWEKPVLIYIDIDPKTAYTRIMNRKICPLCNKVYGVGETVCPECGQELVQRSDDNEETLANRIELYQPRIEEMLEFFKKYGVVHDIDGEPSIEEVTREVNKI